MTLLGLPGTANDADESVLLVQVNPPCVDENTGPVILAPGRSA
jgi:hypothetical protein